MSWTDKPDQTTIITVSKTFANRFQANDFFVRGAMVPQAANVRECCGCTVTLDYVHGTMPETLSWQLLDEMYRLAWGNAILGDPGSMFPLLATKATSRAQHWEPGYQLPDNVMDFCTRHRPLLTNRWHGDFCHENIVMTDDGGFRLIDWRPGPVWGDVYYDLAKYWKGLCFSHKTLRERQSRSYYRKWLSAHSYDVLIVERIYALVILSMSGCHHNDVGRMLFERGKELIREYY